MNYNKRKSIVIWTHLKIWVKSGQTSFRYNQNIWVPIQGRSRWKSWRLSRTKINCVRSNLILAQNTYSVDCGFLYKEAKYLRKQTRLKSLTMQCAAQKRWFWAAGSRLCCWQNGEKEEEEWVLCTGCLTWADHQDHGSVPACPAWALVVDLGRAAVTWEQELDAEEVTCCERGWCTLRLEIWSEKEQESDWVSEKVGVEDGWGVWHRRRAPGLQSKHQQTSRFWHRWVGSICLWGLKYFQSFLSTTIFSSLLQFLPPPHLPICNCSE